MLQQFFWLINVGQAPRAVSHEHHLDYDHAWHESAMSLQNSMSGKMAQFSKKEMKKKSAYFDKVLVRTLKMFEKEMISMFLIMKSVPKTQL